MKAMSIGALAELSGMSERAIRLYEQHGLLQPQRTAAGRRTFAEADARRLMNIVALRALGCTLKEITTLAEQHAIDVARVLGMWTDSIAAQQARLADVSQQLESALSRITAGEVMPLEALCALLSKVDQDASATARRALINRWFLPADQATWQQANAKAGAARMGGPKWAQLFRQAESAIERRIQPDSAEGARIGARFAGLMGPIQAHVDADLWNRGALLMQKGALASNDEDAKRTRRVYEWLARAAQHGRARGR